VTAFGPRRLLTPTLRTVTIRAGARYCDLRTPNLKLLDACPHLSREGGCPAAVRIVGGYKRGPECLAGERRHRDFAGTGGAAMTRRAAANAIREGEAPCAS
jgi:hypothetical protein